MPRRALTSPNTIMALLIVQIIPLMLLPASSFSARTQEWWLPLLLAAMVMIADVYLIVRRSSAVWPWDLIAFAQGFNIISRLMMVWPRATVAVEGGMAMNVPYVVFSALSIGMSAFLLWYTELPDVRGGLLH